MSDRERDMPTSGTAGAAVAVPADEVSLATNLGPLELRNPILAASGAFGYGEEYKAFYENSVLGGFVTKEAAAREYGVVLTGDGRGIDVEATRARRSQRPQTKMFHRKDYADVLT